MPTTAQPSAGTALPSNSLTTGLIFARNEADTTASTVLAGSSTINVSPTDGSAYSTDGDGRYKTFGTAGQYWDLGATCGPEYTWMFVVKRVSNGADQMIACHDPNTPRDFWLSIQTDGTLRAVLFRTTDVYAGEVGTTATVSTTTPSTIIYRVKSDGGGGYTASVTIDGVSTGETSFGGTPESSSTLEIGSRITTLMPLASKLYFEGVWSRAISDAERTSLSSNGWAIFDSVASGVTIDGNLGTATAAGFAASIVGAVTIACALGSATASGHQADISTGSNVTISASLGTATASGYSATVVSSGSATITSDVFKNNTGTVLSSTSIPKVVAVKLSDLTVGASWTSQTTDGSGVLTLTDAGLTTATDYILVVSSTDGASVGAKKYTAI